MAKKKIHPIEFLRSQRIYLLKTLRDIIKKNKFNYRTFGTDIEDYILPVIIKLLKDGGLIKKEEDYHRAENKNEFPDLTLRSCSNLALDIKAGNYRKKIGGGWADCRNSNNDLGTLSEWDKKIKKYGGNNIFFFFIEYRFDDTAQDIINIKIDNFYKFLDLNQKGSLKYREKDGNLRPKDFDKISKIETLQQFENLLNKTIIFRSRRIIKKHRKIIDLAKNKI